MGSLHGSLSLANHLRRGRNRRADGSRVDFSHLDDFVVALTRNHVLIEKLAITRHVCLSLGIGCDGGGEIRDGQAAALLRGAHALSGLAEIGAGVFDRDLVVARVEIDQRLAVLNVKVFST